MVRQWLTSSERRLCELHTAYHLRVPKEDRAKRITFQDLNSYTYHPNKWLKFWRWVWAGIRVLLDAIFYGAPGS